MQLFWNHPSWVQMVRFKGQKSQKTVPHIPKKNKQTNSWTIWISISTHLPLNDEASISQDIMVFLAIHLRSGNQTHGEVEILWNSHI
jgi:hypothetical protein